MSTLHKIGIVLLLLSASLAGFTTIAPAHAANFSAIQNGNWNDPATWGGAVPTAADDVTIPGAITVTITATTERNSGSTVYNNGTLVNNNTLNNSGVINNNNLFNNSASGTISNAGTLNNHRFYNRGAFVNTNSGTINNDTMFANANNGTLHNQGTITNNAGGILNDSGSGVF